jgi:hypothetical protein
VLPGFFWWGVWVSWLAYRGLGVSGVEVAIAGTGGAANRFWLPCRFPVEFESVRGRGCSVNLERLLAPLSVVGLSVTAGVPPLIYEVAVARMTGGESTSGPWTFFVQPDAPGVEIPARALPNVHRAPSWPEVAERVSEAIGARPVVMYDPFSYGVLRAHFPDRATTGVFYAWDIARKTLPMLYGDLASNRATSTAQVYGMRGLIAAVLIHAGLIRPAAVPETAIERKGGDGQLAELTM